MNAFGVVVALWMSMLGVANGSTACTDVGTWTSTCEVSNPGTHIDIHGSSTTPGDNSGSTNNTPPGGKPSNPGPNPAPSPTCGSLGCRGGYAVGTIPDVTIDDLASFRPASPTLTGEPDGFGVAGLPTNLVAAASEQRLTGDLLGWPVTVRFVPAGYVFDHGDGSSTASRTGGASWATANLPQFTPTATTHVYRERGRYAAGVTVRYTASVDFGTGTWRPVPGFVTASTTGYGIRIVEASTALVDRTCAENPRGPAC